jgi:predicted O-methyltransferase YrrM
LAELRSSVYRAGAVDRADGTTLQIVPHTLHPDDAAFLRDLVAASKPASTLEVGCATGLTTLAIAEGVSLAGQQLEHTAIDPYAGGAWWGGAARLLFVRAGIGDSVTLDERESVIVLAEWLARGRACDFAIIDGCHWFECALADIALLARIVRPGGVVAVDDLWMPAVEAAVGYALRNLHLTSRETYHRNGKPRIAVMQVGAVDHARPWDSYVA